MSTADTFDAGEVAMGSRPGWLMRFGSSADLKVDLATGQVRRGSPINSSSSFFERTAKFPEGDPTTHVGAEQEVELDLLASSSTGNQAVVFGDGNTEALFRGYCFRNGANHSVSLARRDPNGPIAGTAIASNLAPNATGDATARTNRVKVRARVEAFNSATRVRFDFTQTIVDAQGVETVNTLGGGPFYDSSASRYVTGKPGLLTVGTTNTNVAVYDNWKDNGTAVTLELKAPNCPFYEGHNNTPKIKVDCVCFGAASVQARVWSEVNGIPGAVMLDWATYLNAPADGARSFFINSPLLKGGYFVEVRDTGKPDVTLIDGAPRFVSINQPWFGQSLNTVVFSGKTANPPTVPAAARVYALHVASGLQGSPQVVTPIKVTTTADIGDGVKAYAAEWYEHWGDTPILLVNCAINGMSLQVFRDDLIPDTGSGGTWTSAFRARTGWLNQMLGAIGYRWTFGVLYAGNANISEEDYKGLANSLFDVIDATLLDPGSVVPKVIMMPYARTSPSGTGQRMRNQQVAMMLGGGPRWLEGMFTSDTVQDGPGSPHFWAGPSGGQRVGRRFGRTAAYHAGKPIAIFGPTFTAKFGSAARTTIKLKFSAPIKTRDGRIYGDTPIPIGSFWTVSPDNGATFPPVTSVTAPLAAITGPDEVTLTSQVGAWPLDTTRVDSLRDTPYATSSEQVGQAPDYTGILVTETLVGDIVAGSDTINVTSLTGPVTGSFTADVVSDHIAGPGISGYVTLRSSLSAPGALKMVAPASQTLTGQTFTVNRTESMMESLYWKDMICDRSSYDGGQGLPATPPSGIGIPVAAATAVVRMPIAKGQVITGLTKAQLETLRFIDDGVARVAGTSLEPMTARWNRKTGDLTGSPVDGIDITVTVSA